MQESMNMQTFTDKKNYLQDFTHKGSIEDDTDSYLGSTSGKPLDDSKSIFLQQLLYISDATTPISQSPVLRNDYAEPHYIKNYL